MPLLVFCSELDADIELLRDAFEPLFDSLDLDDVKLAPADVPESVRASGWTAFELSDEADVLSEHLVDLTRRLARTLGSRAVGVAARGDSARACLHGKSGFPRTTDGATFHVARQLARWLEADAAELSRFFSARPPAPALDGPVDLGAVDVEDDDDRFVRQKLKAASELMQRYRASRRP